MIIEHSIHSFWRDAFDVFVHTARELLHEVMHEWRNIFPSFAQRRNEFGVCCVVGTNLRAIDFSRPPFLHSVSWLRASAHSRGGCVCGLYAHLYSASARGAEFAEAA